MTRFILFIFIVLLSLCSRAQSVLMLDSMCNADYVGKLITYKEVYPFVNYHLNYIEWRNYKAVSSFFGKLQETGHRKLKTLHIGDSHLQVDVYPGYVRGMLQKYFGEGGRGFVTPYRAARTHATYDYVTYASGSWESSRNVNPAAKHDMGINGATVRTADSNATFRFIFLGDNILPSFRRLKIYCKQGTDVFDVGVKASSCDSVIWTSCADTGKPYVQVMLPQGADTLEFLLKKRNADQKYWECHGIMIDTPDDKGVLHNSVGINGSGYKSVLRQNLMYDQLKELQPDLVMIDVGGNDFSTSIIDTAMMEYNLRSIITLLRSAVPDVNIIVCSMGDSYLRKRHYSTTTPFARLVRRVAFDTDCALFDYFYIMGGDFSMLEWYKAGLVQSDRIHYNQRGYETKGEIFMNALWASYRQVLLGKTDSLIVDRNRPDTILVPQKSPDKASPIFVKVPTHTPPTQSSYEIARGTKGSGNAMYYEIQPGDNLGSIAQRFGVSVSDIQSWNGLYGTRIVAGESLMIYPRQSGGSLQNTSRQNNTTITTQQNTTNTTTTKTYPKTGKLVTHTVKQGDTLWALSQQYGVSVDQIKTLSNMPNDKLKIGQVLTISH